MDEHLLRRSAPVAAAAVAAALALTLAAGGDGRPAPGHTTTATTTASPAVAAVDRVRPATLDLGGGWAVTDTEGDAPMVTVLHEGVPVGIVELLDFPLGEPAGDELAALDAQVARFYDEIGADLDAVADGSTAWCAPAASRTRRPGRDYAPSRPWREPAPWGRFLRRERVRRRAAARRGPRRARGPGA